MYKKGLTPVAEETTGAVIDQNRTDKTPLRVPIVEFFWSFTSTKVPAPLIKSNVKTSFELTSF